MATGMSSHSWVKFFKDAGIPSELSARYAVMFTDHRIQKDMLAEIDREILSDIGIKAVGDKMAIMKHSRFIAEQAKRDASSKQLADGIKTLENRSAKSSSPAERMINHTINSRSPSGRNSPKILGKSSPKTELDEKKPDSPTEDSKSSVFERLGRNSPVHSPSKSPSGVFKRLGGGSAEDSALPYAGVLKKPPSPIGTPTTTAKKILVTNKSKPKSVLDRLGAEVPQKPDSSVPEPRGSPVIKKVIRIKKKPATPPQKIVLPPTKIVLSPSKPSQMKTGVSTSNPTTTKRKSNVLDRLGDIVVTSTTKSMEKQSNAAEESPAPVKRKLIVFAPKTGVKIGLKRRSTGDLQKPLTVSVKKPISSNTVSSTSAGLFRGGKKSSVFDRLGAK